MQESAEIQKNRFVSRWKYHHSFSSADVISYCIANYSQDQGKISFEIHIICGRKKKIDTI